MLILLNKLVDRINFVSYLVVVMTLGLFGLIVLVIFHKVPQDVQTVVFSLISTVAGSVSTIVAFRFGSSQGSENKTKAILLQDK